MTASNPVLWCATHKRHHLASDGCRDCRLAAKADAAVACRLIPNPDGSLSWAVEDQARRNSQDALDVLGQSFFRAMLVRP